jgi:hypothetical protein
MFPFLTLSLCLRYSWGQNMGPLTYFVAGATPLLDKYGVYGILYDMAVQDTAKTRAVDKVRQAPRPPPFVALPALPGLVINATQYVNHRVPDVDPCLRYLGVNSTFFYLARTPASLPDQATLRVSVSTSGSLALPLEVSIGATTTATSNVATQATGDWDKFLPSSVVEFPLTQPDSVIVIRLRVLVERGYNIASLVLDIGQGKD